MPNVTLDGDSTTAKQVRRPTVHLTVGLPCSGKTTFAKALAARTGALRLTPDDWHCRLFGDDTTDPDHDRRHDTVETIMWNVTSELAARSLDVILDFGFEHRPMGARTMMLLLDISIVSDI